MSGVGNGGGKVEEARRVARGLVEIYGDRALDKAQSLAADSSVREFAGLVYDEVKSLLAGRNKGAPTG
jgi:hypothetical protein